LIVVDTSAWVELLRKTESPIDRQLTRLIEERASLAVTEVVIMELLAGSRSGEQRAIMVEMLMGLPVLPLEGLSDFELAAALYTDCRAGGETVRTLLDCLIAIAAIEAQAPILHCDRDFDILARHTPLEVVALDD